MMLYCKKTWGSARRLSSPPFFRGAQLDLDSQYTLKGGPGGAGDAERGGPPTICNIRARSRRRVTITQAPATAAPLRLVRRVRGRLIPSLASIPVGSGDAPHVEEAGRAAHAAVAYRRGSSKGITHLPQNAATSTPPRLLASSVVSPSSRNRAPGPGLPPPSPLPVSPFSTMSFAPQPPTPSKSTPNAVRQRLALARGGSDDDEDDGQEMEVDS
ncbi:hypothetical protein B0H14DRAFT_3135151 [Mycena olivaceomarginata]|nr:hypothetical protein B0H14DRAFT_3135151 [Mycena olivaceomarginata]